MKTSLLTTLTLDETLTPVKKYSPDQLRDSRGRFAAGGATTASRAAAKSPSPKAHMAAMQAHIKAALSHAKIAQKGSMLASALKAIAGSAALITALHGYRSLTGNPDTGGRGPFSYGPFSPKPPRTPRPATVHIPRALPPPPKLLTSAGAKTWPTSPYRPR